MEEKESCGYCNKVIVKKKNTRNTVSRTTVLIKNEWREKKIYGRRGEKI